MDRPSRVGRTIAIGGGKGGVGKSLVSTNLAVSLARLGANVVMLDADLGAPNLHTMFGIMRPPRTVDDFLAGRIGALEDVAVQTPIKGLRIICGEGGALGSANPSFQSKERLLEQLARLDADCLIIDVGAGVDLNTIDFFNAADTRLIVMVPEITSMQNGYAFLKFALFRRLQRAISGVRVSEKLNATFGNDVFAIGSSMDKVSTFFSLLEDEVPELVEHFKLLLAEFNASIVGNMLHRPEDQNALFAIQRVVRERLGIHVELAASIRQNPNMRNSVNTGQPFAVTGGRDPDAAEIHQLARNVLQQDLAPIRGLRERFLRAMARVPAPANVDARFEFGLAGISKERPPARPAAESQPLPSEFKQLQRSSERIKLYVPIELNFDGRWYMGQLTEANEGGGSVSGIRAPDTWRTDARGALRNAGDSGAGIPIELHSATPGTGHLVVRFSDAISAGRLVADLKRRRPNQAA
jgi:flagellar biosynthesis protein FlhG